jgi:hypothetical protein
MLLKIYRSGPKAAIISRIPGSLCDANHSLLRELDGTVHNSEKLETPGKVDLEEYRERQDRDWDLKIWEFRIC